MKNKTKKIIKSTGVVFIGITGLIVGYKIGKSIGYDKGVFDVLNESLKDNGNLKITKF